MQFDPQNGSVMRTETIEFRQLGGDRRRLIIEPTVGEEHSEATPPFPRKILVAAPDMSFIVEKTATGQVQVAFVSLKGGFGEENVLQTSLNRQLLMRACCAFVFDPLSEMIASGRLVLEEATFDPEQIPERLELRVLRLVPSPMGWSPKGSPQASEFDHFEGTVTVLPKKHWVIEQLHLNRVFNNNGVGSPLDVRVTYRNVANDEAPVMASAEWLSGLHFRLQIDDISFGTVTPEDFTPQGCGITPLQPGRRPLPMFFWYSTVAFLLCVVGLWLIRRHQRAIARML